MTASTGPTSPANPASPTGRSGPAGAWTARIGRETETSANTFHFTGDGRVFLADGGAGTWTATGPASFGFRIAEPIYDGTGACVGWVDIDQRAVLSGTTFTSEGVSLVRDSEGRTLRTTRVTVTASRV
ncbi:hypothetical protein [Streptomyces sp. NPDC057617]|uniref:hypothetical protein n=1 Tax=Streptomyces sp. NPDC057617 TaxID=3346184 RepID=UPI0036934F9A